MRSNGLTASSYSPVADLDPRVADALLVELKEQGVAAYTRPVESTTMSGFDRPEIIDGALDRLYVDAGASDEVRSQLTAKDPSLATKSDDLTWAQIVAEFDQPVQQAVNPWPANEDLDWSAAGSTDDESDDDSDGEREGGQDPSRGRAGDLRGWLAQRDATRSETPAEHGGNVDDTDLAARRRDDDDEDRFVPDQPPPLPKLEPFKQLAWVGLIGGPLLLLVSALFAISLPGLLSALAIGGFVGGFVTLVSTMGDRDDDWDSHNGAVV